ncbi:hypothetical protein MRX96_038058 [Rhipicephalus microplus]
MPVISSPFEAVLKVEEFSSCSRVVRLTAWVRRFVNNCRRGKERKGGPLRAEEVIDAESVEVQEGGGSDVGIEPATSRSVERNGVINWPPRGGSPSGVKPVRNDLGL